MNRSTELAEQLRYERKFLITDYSYPEVEQLIKFHPSCFSEIFQERIVNNIYFDTLGMTSYNDNTDGQVQRSKIRIRWYGGLFGNINKPVLEYKIKDGLIGDKKSFPLEPFILDNSFNRSQIIQATETKLIPKTVKNELLSLTPTLLNSYKRKYFQSANKKFRITIDRHLTYYKIGYGTNLFINKSRDNESTVLELKYDVDMENEANKVANAFPFMLTKNSKYLQGLERVLI